ncbi:hypothetical protein [Tenacibaculum amylolyticum]|uniref:hypothetical protein n=1 Tax=Tenacibaculum amylolyticum TaxID=104269 RepID=UPI0038957853
MSWQCNSDEHWNPTEVSVCEICDTPRPTGVLYFFKSRKGLFFSWNFKNCNLFKLNNEELSIEGEKTIPLDIDFINLEISNNNTQLVKKIDLIDLEKGETDFEIPILPSFGVILENKTIKSIKGTDVKVPFKTRPKTKKLTIVDESEKIVFNEDEFTKHFIVKNVLYDKKISFIAEDEYGNILESEVTILTFNNVLEELPLQPLKEHFLDTEKISLKWNYVHCSEVTLVTPHKTYTSVEYKVDDFKIPIKTVSEKTNTKCTLYISDLIGGKKEPISINVPVYPAIKIDSFRASKNTISPKEIVRINWNIENYSKILLHANEAVFDVTLKKEFLLRPDESSILYLEIISLGEIETIISESIHIEVCQPIEIDFTCDDKILIEGQNTTIKWSVKNATSVKLISDEKILEKLPNKGKLTISPKEDNYYSLEASNSIDTWSSTLKIKIIPTPKLELITLPIAPKLSFVEVFDMNLKEKLPSKETVEISNLKILQRIAYKLKGIKKSVSYFFLSEIDRKNISHTKLKLHPDKYFFKKVLKPFKMLSK